MKSNRGITPSSPTPNMSNLYQTLSTEKEALVTMFLSSATHSELTQQIQKIDDLCTKIDSQHKRQMPR